LNSVKWIDAEKTGSASPLAKEFAGLTGQNWGYNQLTTPKDVNNHISRIETLTAHGLPAVRFAIHGSVIALLSLPEKSRGRVVKQGTS
jgi:hypothetical protein